jgi:hypothetical protein
VESRLSGKGGWAGAAIASSAALRAIWFFRMTVRAGLAFSIADLGHLQVTSGLSDLAFVLTVISCFPSRNVRHVRSVRALAGGHHLDAVLLGGCSSGRARPARRNDLGQRWVWAPDGAYALISQIVLFAWIAVLSGFLAMRPSAARPRSGRLSLRRKLAVPAP